MSKIYPIATSCMLLLCLILFSSSCSSPSSKNQKSKEVKDSLQTADKLEAPPNNIKPNVKIYLENSGSMFGYLGAGGDFASVVAKIAANCDRKSKVVDYRMINGTETAIGNDLESFINSLSISGMNRGNTATSNLNQIFGKALAHAGKGKVSILISDGIYSVNGSPNELLARLRTQCLLTQNKFIDRLEDEDLTTYVVKLKSRFEGNYYPAQGGQVNIKQKRPYYIWVIGNNRDVEKIFPENYFEKLDGYDKIVKFIKLDSQTPNCGFLNHNKVGSYRYANDLTLMNVKPHRLKTAFSVGFDFSNIPLPNSYFDQIEVYRNNLGYKAVSVTHFEDLTPRAKSGAQVCIKSFCTHVVTFEKHKAPWGNMRLQISNLKPIWVDQTHDEDDSDIVGDENNTFGFGFLIKGINDAYDEVNASPNLAEYTIQINQQ